METKRYTKIEFDGTYFVCEPQDAQSFMDGEGNYNYVVSEIFMTEEQFKRLPEFDGF